MRVKGPHIYRNKKTVLTNLGLKMKVKKKNNINNKNIHIYNIMSNVQIKVSAKNVGHWINV